MTNKGGYVMKKKRIAVAMLAATMVLGAAPCAFAADQITVMIDGEKVNFEDQQPVNIDGRVMVPIRDVAEKMGWEVEWFTYYGDTVVDGTFQIEHSAIFTKPIASTDRYMAGYHSSLNIEDKTKTKSVWGATHILTQGEDVPVSAPVKVINDRTLVGIRDLADCMYADAQWDAETRTVVIKTTPTENLPQYNEILANVASVKNQAPQEIPETKPTLTIEEEQRQRTEKYAAEQNAKRDEIAEEIIRLTNAEREKVGLNPLEMDNTLMKAADVRVKEMGESFSHTRPDGRKFVTAVEEAGYPNSYVGENIAFGVGDAKSALSLWMYSEGHKQNILNPDYEKMGAAYIYDLDNEETYWIQIFAK